MTKISETVHWDENDKKMIVQEQHNFHAVAEQAKALKSAGVDGLGKDNKLVGRIPMKLWYEWAKKWGVKATDHEAMRQVVARELNDSANAHFRVWEGRI